MDMELFKEMAGKANGKSLIDACLEEITCLRQQLAAALAACEVKDAAIIKVYGCYPPPYARDRSAVITRDALAIQPDASTLKAHDDALIERCANVCEEYQGGAETCAAAIRELKSQL